MGITPAQIQSALVSQQVEGKPRPDIDQYAQYYELLSSVSEQDLGKSAETELGNRLRASPDEQLLVGAYVADKAVGMIPDNASVFIGSGAGTYYFYLALAAFHRKIEIYTNNMLVAAAYASRKSEVKRLTVLGTGEVDREYGHVTVQEDVLAEHVEKCDYSIVCPTYFDSELGPSTMSADTRHARRVIFSANRGKIIILSDSTKMSYSPREEDAVYDYSRKEWGDVYSDHKADLVLVTTRHPGIGSDVPKGSRGTYVKEPGVEKSFSTYCRRSYEFWDKLKTNFIELPFE